MTFRPCAILLFASLLGMGFAGCTGHGNSSSESTASPSAESTSAAVESPAAGSATEVPSASATEPATGAAPASTPDPNLLSVGNGTIVRSYSPVALDHMNDGSLRNAANGVGSELPADAKPPYILTFELAAPATITGFQANLRAAETGGPTPSVTFAISSTGPASGFSDVGTISGTATTLAANAKARWVRVTANQLFASVGATGTLAAPPAALKPTGVYVEQIDPDKDGSFVMSGTRDGYERVRFVMVGSSLVGTECTKTELRGTYLGRLDGRTWNATFPGNKDANPAAVRGIVNDDASIIAGTDPSGSSATYFTRTDDNPAFCRPRTTGRGAHTVLVLDQDPTAPFYPADAAPALPGYVFSAIGAGMLDESALQGKDVVVTRSVCKVPELLIDEQRALLLKWVAAGHKLILGGGQCPTGADFKWLPYPFSTAPGPEAPNGSLIQVENSALGTNDKNDAGHYIDVNGYAADANNSLPGAGVVTTKDPHWCGHFFVAKPTNVNGFVQMYASQGNGTLIYDGFNEDGKPALQRARQLELALPVPASLPCTQSVTESFLLEPNQEATFRAGTAQTIPAPMRVLANQGWSGKVTVKSTGDFPATIAPNEFALAGGTVNLSVGVHVPATAKGGVYTVTIAADNGGGQNAQASITLTGTAPLVKHLAPTQKRIRIYGIHFDVDSAVIQPRSEPVIAEIAQLMRSDPSVRFQVEGHTDSDGGAAYNLGLSQRRAQAVVDDLVTRYGIARGRLVAKGFGLTQPVAGNATPAGKALNRRVELLRL